MCLVTWRCSTRWSWRAITSRTSTNRPFQDWKVGANDECGWVDGCWNINRFCFALAANLQYLRLGDNNLHIIPSDALRQLHRLRHLDLRSNNITVVSEDALVGYGDTITFLNLQKNEWVVDYTAEYFYHPFPPLSLSVLIWWHSRTFFCITI